MKSRKSNLGKEPSDVTRQGEPEGGAYQTLKRVAQMRGIKPSNRHARLSQHWRAYFEKYAPR